jgi:hypothetical protein
MCASCGTGCAGERYVIGGLVTLGTLWVRVFGLFDKTRFLWMLWRLVREGVEGLKGRGKQSNLQRALRLGRESTPRDAESSDVRMGKSREGSKGRRRGGGWRHFGEVSFNKGPSALRSKIIDKRKVVYLYKALAT